MRKCGKEFVLVFFFGVDECCYLENVNESKDVLFEGQKMREWE